MARMLAEWPGEAEAWIEYLCSLPAAAPGGATDPQTCEGMTVTPNALARALQAPLIYSRTRLS